MISHEKALFDELNRRLSREGTSLTVICVGGYVLSRYGIRVTQDIDGFFETMKNSIR